MIKFFRLSKHHFVKQNQISSGYLVEIAACGNNKTTKYAIGEIILVVIGILIALQINNWNQDRNEYKRTKTLLSNLKLDVEENIKYLKDLQKSIEIRKDYADFIIKSLDNRKVTDSSMFISAMTRVMWIFNDSQKLPTYNEIISSGNLAYINSENLKNELARYQSQVEELQQIGIPFNLMLAETGRLAISHLQGMPESSMLIKPVSSYPGVSFDLKAIASDTEFYKSVKYISFSSADAIKYINDLSIASLERLKILIDNEIKSNDK